MKPGTVLFGLTVTAALMYAAACGALFAFQRTLLYHPQPAQAGVPSLRLPVAGAELQISTRALPGEKALLYFGGNAEDVAGSEAVLARLFPKHALYLMHYRGYGTSSGEPTEASLHADAQSLWRLVSRSHSDITLMGRSLGSGVAVRLASQQPSTSRLILVTPYDSIAAVAAAKFPWAPVRWLLTDSYDSESLAADLKMPITVVAAENDQVIDTAHTQKLLGRLDSRLLQFTEIPGAGHNDLQQSPVYAVALQAPR